jgi:hypothetical protein
MSVYDFSSTQSPYQLMPLNKDSVIDLFGLEFHPEPFISILLARYPFQKSRDVQVFSKNNYGKINSLVDDWSVSAIFDAGNALLKEMRWTNQAMGVSYSAKYQNITNIDGHQFARLLVVNANNKSASFGFELYFEHMEINGAPLELDQFLLKPY